MLPRFITLICGLWFVWLQAFSTIEISSESLNISNGLANNTVRYITQDSKGFMWFGTLNGLNRYDGNSFLTYQPSSNNLSLASGKVYSIDEDRNGFLWVSVATEQQSVYDLKHARFVDFTAINEMQQNYSKKLFASNGDVWLWHSDNGTRRVSYTQGEFSSVIYSVQNKNLPHNRVRFIKETNPSTIWVGTSGGLLKVEQDSACIIDGGENFHHMIRFKKQDYFFTQDGKILQYNISTAALVKIAQLPLENDYITGYYLLDNCWVICTSKGSFAYNFTHNTIAPYINFTGHNIAFGNVLTDNRGNYWIYNKTGKVWYINLETGQQKMFELMPQDKLGYIDTERYSIVHDSRNIIWISTYGNGLFAYDIANDVLNHFNTSNGGHNYIGSDYLLHVMEDRSGSIWVGTEYLGVARLSIINQGVQRYLPEENTKQDRINTVRLIALIESDIWVGTRHGALVMYDSLLHKKKALKNLNSNIYALAKDTAEKLWMGTRGNGLFIDNVSYKNNIENPYSISNDNIFCIYKDSKNRMWIGAFNGGLNLAEKVGEEYRFHRYLNKSYGQRQTRSICEDKNGMIWVGTSNGVYIFKPEEFINNPENYYHYGYATGKLHSDEVKYVFADSRGDIIISTAGAGIALCTDLSDYNKLNFVHYSSKDGLCNDIVQSIIEDNEGNIWLGTEYGLAKFIIAEKKFENYLLSSNSQGNVYTESVVGKLNDSTLLFGTNHGFIALNTQLIKKTLVKTQPVVFTNLIVNGALVFPDQNHLTLTKALAYTHTIKLKHNQNSIRIYFSTFNYADGNLTQYSYKLTHYDKQWSIPSTLNFADYKVLPPGKYELNVRSGNSSGGWNKDISTLKIIISPPFYLTSWAFVLYTLLLLIAIYLVYKVLANFNHLNNKIAIEKQLTDYKLMFFTNISHEFRTPLTLIKGSVDRMQRTGKYPEELQSPLRTMEKSTNRLLKLIDQLLEFRKMQNNSLALSLEKADVISFLNEIFLSFSDVAESKNIHFSFVSSLTNYNIYIDKGKVDKIVYNILSNAFKYTPKKGTITLTVNENKMKQVLEIKVSDTGIGIPKEKQAELFKRFMQSNFSRQSVGIGLHLTYELVQVHKGSIYFIENELGGSVFIVELPLLSDTYKETDFLVPTVLMEQEANADKFVTDTIDDVKANELLKFGDPLNKHRLLIIEDDPDVRQYLQEELTPYFNIIAAENGILGLQAAHEQEIDFIVCDVMMPKMNGFEVVKRLKNNFETSHIPIILLTALSLTENKIEGIESGADAYLTKPFSSKLLLAHIIKLLEQREKLKEKFSQESGFVRTSLYVIDRDKEFVEQLNQVLLENLNNPNFTIDAFCSQMKVGRTIFYKKVKGLTGYSPNEYIRIIRMKRGAELLLTNKYTISEVTYMVGMEDPFYFSKCFKSQFGITPSKYKGGNTETT